MNVGDHDWQWRMVERFIYTSVFVGVGFMWWTASFYSSLPFVSAGLVMFIFFRLSDENKMYYGFLACLYLFYRVLVTICTRIL